MHFSSQELRDALGRFATGVCVIATCPEGEKPFGMTVNSFASVSLDPPLVLWSLQKDSDCFTVFERAQQFSVNILANTQAGISNQYATKGDHHLDEGSYRQGRSGCVLLKDVMTAFECDIEARHDGGDHIIIVGRVLEISNRAAGKPLVFYNGEYRELK